MTFSFGLIKEMLMKELMISIILNCRDCGTERCDFLKAKVELHNSLNQMVLKQGEKYEFIVDLHIPECDSNFDVGKIKIKRRIDVEVWEKLCSLCISNIILIFFV